MTYAILFIGAVLFLGQVFSFLFEKTRLPDVLPLMLLGMLIGPGLHIVTPDMFGSAGQIFTTLALVVVLFKSWGCRRIGLCRSGGWGGDYK